MQITWPTDDPRAARIVGARPGAPWANWFYVMMNELLVIALLMGGLFLVLTLFGRRRRKSRRVQA